tara:strand:+ start:431 stop:604 length:174 start_codon:yes stop_codon:yes gene_type:complete
MIKRLLFLILILNSCSGNSEKVNLQNDFQFNDNLSFEEFKTKLDEYAIKNPYPNIDG